jgi:hypothetical protein
VKVPLRFNAAALRFMRLLVTIVSEAVNPGGFSTEGGAQ